MPVNIDIPGLRAIIRKKDKKWERRVKAIRTLGELGDTSVVPDLLDALYDEDISVRLATASALAKIGDKTALKGLISELGSNESNAREAAVWALQDIGGTKAVNALTDTVRNDLNTRVRLDAIRALGQIGDPSAVPIILQAYRENPESFHYAVREALEKIGDTGAVNGLIEMLDSPKGDIKAYAISSLAKIGDKSAVPSLIKTFNEDTGIFRANAAFALGELEDISAFPVLLAALPDASLDLRQAVIVALGKLGDGRAVPAIVEQLSMKNIWENRTYKLILEALERIATPEALSTSQAWRRKYHSTIRRHQIEDRIGAFLNRDVYPYKMWWLIELIWLVVLAVLFTVGELSGWLLFFIAISPVIATVIYAYGVILPITLFWDWMKRKPNM